MNILSIYRLRVALRTCFSLSLSRSLGTCMSTCLRHTDSELQPFPLSAFAWLHACFCRRHAMGALKALPCCEQRRAVRSYGVAAGGLRAQCCPRLALPSLPFGMGAAERQTLLTRFFRLALAHLGRNRSCKQWSRRRKKIIRCGVSAYSTASLECASGIVAIGSCTIVLPLIVSPGGFIMSMGTQQMSRV